MRTADNIDRLDREALYADETIQFRCPQHADVGETVTFRFRTAKDNADEVWLWGRMTRRRMTKKYTKGRFDFYESEVKIKAQSFCYFFEVVLGEEHAIYDKLGVSNSFDRRLEEHYFRLLPGFSTPDWAKGVVMYQIFVDRFRNGDPSNDVLTGEYMYLDKRVQRVSDWNELPNTLDVARFYGGDLNGVLEKLDYLKHLGIEAIYFNPLFVSPSNHKYDSQDYDYIDPHLTGFVNDKGRVLPKDSTKNTDSTRYMNRVTDRENLEAANEYFAHLVEEIHKRGMKVILDGVFNHCGSFNKWMDAEKIYDGKPGYAPGAYVSEDSPYRDYFMFEEDGQWPDNDSYLGWWNHKTLPKLNYEDSEELHDYIMGIAKKWLNPPYNVDGWRLDVAADLGKSAAYNHKFWKDFRKAVKETNPEAVILAEHYGDPNDWLKGDEWDSVMNYDAFMEPVSYFLTGMEKHSDSYNEELHGNGQAFFDTMNRTLSRFPIESAQVAMNELSNHDHSRFLTRTNSKVGRLNTVGSRAAGIGTSKALMKCAVVMQFTLPGAPTIYYGDEVGTVGWTDPDSRRTYPWGREDFDLLTFHKDIILIHKEFQCMKTGSTIPVECGKDYVAYGRFTIREAAVVLVNISKKDRYVEVPVWKLNVEEEGTAVRVMQTWENGYNVGRLKKKYGDGLLRTTIPAMSSEIYIFS